MRYSVAVKLIATLLAFVAFFPTVALAQAPGSSLSEPDLALGRWDAILTVERRAGSPYEVGFEFSVQRAASSALNAELINGSEARPFTRVEWKDGVLKLFIGEYDGEVTLKCADTFCSRLAGEYTRLTRMGQMHYPVKAKRPANPSAAPMMLADKPSLAGDWLVTMWGEDASKKETAPAHFVQNWPPANRVSWVAGEVEGTVAAVSGDYGNMHGTITANTEGTSFRLSRFDGNHTNLMEGIFLPDGSLKGTIAFSPLSTVQFTAVRSAGNAATQKAVAESESLTRMRDPGAVFHFAAEDPQTGRVITEADFKGKPLIVDVFGSWCPNCHDEAPLLVELYKRYHAQGLEMVGISYEYTAEKERNKRLVYFFRTKYGIDYALLLGGSTEEAGKKLGQLEGFGVYPTTLFIDRAGKVRAIHVGFEGKATGQYEDVKKRFEETVKEIMKAE